MFEYNTVIITKRGSIEDGVNFSVHHFPVSSEADIKAITSHPAFAGWKYGISVGLAKL